MTNDIYKEKYLKYKNKYLELQKLVGGNNRRELTCSRNHNCKNILDKLVEVKKIINGNCNRMEFLEKVPSKDPQLDQEYKELLQHIEKFLKNIKDIGVDIPESNCKI